MIQRMSVMGVELTAWSVMEEMIAGINMKEMMNPGQNSYFLIVKDTGDFSAMVRYSNVCFIIV